MAPQHHHTLASTAWSHKLVSPKEMAAFDARTIAHGVPSLELMERAGQGVLKVLKKRFSPAALKKAQITILCGPGNNGGDGLVLARHFYKMGVQPTVIIASSNRYSADCKSQMAKLATRSGRLIVSFPNESAEALGVAIGSVDEVALKRILGRSTLVVDALLGTGQKDPPSGAIKEIINLLCAVCGGGKSSPFILAVDIPTGVNADSGVVYEPAIKADLTVAIELLKRGMVQYPARSACGDMVVVPIGIDCSEKTEYRLLDEANCPKLSKRAQGGHKGTYGRVLVIGGSKNMPGAPVLSAVAALRSGAGLVTLAHLEGLPCPGLVPELLLQEVPNHKGYFDLEVLSSLTKAIGEASCIVIGPGLGTAPETAAFLGTLLKQADDKRLPTVIDADALNILSAASLPTLKNSVLTPHPGEMGRLLKISTTQVQADRYGAASRLAQLTGAVVVLKGASSVIYQGEQGFVNTTGNSYMATAGSGDVLSGIIAALIAQGHSIFDAAAHGVFAHGRAGDLALQSRGGPIIASDILDNISKALNVGKDDSI